MSTRNVLRSLAASLFVAAAGFVAAAVTSPAKDADRTPVAAPDAHAAGARLADVQAPKDALARKGWSIVRDGNARGATPCSACHGMDGSGRLPAGIPGLAGQEASYLKKQLRDFQSGTRTHFMMQPVAQALSDEDVDAVAAYFSKLPPRAVTPSSQQTQVLAYGMWIAQRGIAEKHVPACGSCHGPDGAGVPPMFPRLQGQSAAYIKAQFERIKRGERANDPGGMMRAVANGMSPEDIRAVAAYFESLGQQAPPTASLR
jgi:cytochrome c553